MELEIVFTADDVLKESDEIRTFQKEIWLNLNDGTFLNKKALLSNPDNPEIEILTLSELYHSIKTVRRKGTLIAKRKNVLDSLVAVERPIQQVLTF